MRHFSAAEIVLMKQMARERCHSAATIANCLGRSVLSVQKKASRLHVRLRYRKPASKRLHFRVQPETFVGLQKAAAERRMTVTRLLCLMTVILTRDSLFDAVLDSPPLRRSLGRAWNDGEVRRAQSLLADGDSANDVALALGRTVDDVAQKCREIDNARARNGGDDFAAKV